MVLRLDDVVRAGGVGGQFCPRLARSEFADGGCGKDDRHARASVFCGDGEGQGAVLDGATMLTPYALFLQWNADGKTIRQCVTPDMADKESYRRLKVWARWCQAQNAGHPL